MPAALARGNEILVSNLSEMKRKKNKKKKEEKKRARLQGWLLATS